MPAPKARSASAKTKVVNGRVVSAKSRTGSAACSQAMSDWVRTRKAGTTPASVYAQLGKCRSMARAGKQATQHRAAGNEAKAQRYEAIAAGKKGPISAKDRLARAKELRAELNAKRAGAGAAPVAAKAPLRKPRDPEIVAARKKVADDIRSQYRTGEQNVLSNPDYYRQSPALSGGLKDIRKSTYRQDVKAGVEKAKSRLPLRTTAEERRLDDKTQIAIRTDAAGSAGHRRGLRSVFAAPSFPSPKAPGRGTPERLRAAKFLAEKRRVKNAAKGGSYSAEGIARSEYNAARAVVGSGTPQRLLKRKSERTRAEVAAKQAARNEMRFASANRRLNDAAPGIRHFGDELAMPGQKSPGRMTRDDVAQRLRAERAAKRAPSPAAAPVKPSLREQANAFRAAKGDRGTREVAIHDRAYNRSKSLYRVNDPTGRSHDRAVELEQLADRYKSSAVAAANRRIAAESAAPKPVASPKMHRPAMTGDLIASYRDSGMDRSRAWDQFVIDRQLKPEIGAKAFYAAFDSMRRIPSSPAASPAVPRPSLKDQAAAHRASKGTTAERAKKLNTKLQGQYTKLINKQEDTAKQNDLYVRVINHRQSDLESFNKDVKKRVANDDPVYRQELIQSIDAAKSSLAAGQSGFGQRHQKIEKIKRYARRIRSATDRAPAPSSPSPKAPGRGTPERLAEAAKLRKMKSRAEPGERLVRTESGSLAYRRKAMFAAGVKPYDGSNFASQTPAPVASRPLGAFGQTLNPLARGKAKAALDATVSHNGNVMTRKAMIDAAIKNGATVQQAQGGRRLTSSSGAFLDEKATTKTGMNYADSAASRLAQARKLKAERAAKRAGAGAAPVAAKAPSLKAQADVHREDLLGSRGRTANDIRAVRAKNRAKEFTGHTIKGVRLVNGPSESLLPTKGKGKPANYYESLGRRTNIEDVVQRVRSRVENRRDARHEAETNRLESARNAADTRRFGAPLDPAARMKRQAIAGAVRVNRSAGGDYEGRRVSEVPASAKLTRAQGIVAAKRAPSPAAAPAVPRPSLKDQAAAHRAGKGDTSNRARVLAAKAQKISQKARAASLRADKAGKATVAAKQDVSYRANFARSEALAIKAGYKQPKTSKVIDAKFEVVSSAPVKPSSPALSSPKPSLRQQADAARAARKPETIALERIGANGPRGGASAYVAAIKGPDPKYGAKREFMAGKRDYSNANSARSRGVTETYTLPRGGVYEINEPRSWKNVDRYHVVARAKGLKKVSKERAIEIGARLEKIKAKIAARA